MIRLWWHETHRLVKSLNAVEVPTIGVCYRLAILFLSNFQIHKYKNKMRTRKDIRADISAKIELIKQIESEKKELILEDIQFSDEEIWYTEKEETHEVSKRPKKTETFMVGRTHWKEEFKDEDRPNDPVIIERSRIVRINGVWQW